MKGLPGTFPAKVATLDIGFLNQHSAFPKNTVDPAYNDILFEENGPDTDGTHAGQPSVAEKGWFNGLSHGTATAAIIAGPVRTVATTCARIQGIHYFSGGNPDAYIIPIRVGTSVAAIGVTGHSTFASDEAAGITRANDLSTDVISMCIGGFGSGALADAVNEAYEAGIPIFAASGDFLCQGIPIIKQTPFNVAYPAAYENVMAVVGVSAGFRTYGNPPLGVNPNDQLTLGNFGPEDKMLNAIAGWGPNIPWAAAPDPLAQSDPWNISDNGTNWSMLDFDGRCYRPRWRRRKCRGWAGVVS